MTQLADLFRSHLNWLLGRGGSRLWLEDGDGPGEHLAGFDLTSSVFLSGFFDRADFSSVDFHSAELTDVRARDARFVGARFIGSTLLRCDFTGANFDRADFNSAQVNDCDFRGVRFGDAMAGWSGARFERCDFRGVRGFDATLIFAKFVDCKFDNPMVQAQLIIGEAMDANASFDETIDRLVKSGLSREEAFEMMVSV